MDESHLEAGRLTLLAAPGRRVGIAYAPGLDELTPGAFARQRTDDHTTRAADSRMIYHVKWELIGRDGTAVGPTPHEAPQTAFQYADTVAEILNAMGIDDPAERVWVEDDLGKRIDRPEKTTDS